MGNHKVLRTSGINLRYSMYEFIDAVKTHSIIWDREHEDYHNRELRDQAWHKIGQQLCSNFNTANAAEKQEIAKTLLKRWKNTRDSFLRVNRLRQSGEEIARASYIYEKELNFLDAKNEAVVKEEVKSPLKRKRSAVTRAPIKQRLTDHGNRSSVPDQNEDQDTRNSLHEVGLHAALENLTYADDNSIAAEEAHIRRNTPIPKNEVNTFVVDFNASALNGPATPNANPLVSTDPDQAFFDSIKPHMQKMSGDQKLDFQIEVLKILRNFKPYTN